MSRKVKSLVIVIMVALGIVSCKSVDVEKAQQNIEVVNENGQTRLILSNLHFEGNSAEITDEAANTLDYLKTILVGYQGEAVIITGHAANIGDESAIQAISEERAEAVADYLVKKRTFKSEKITVVGKGASEPIGSDDKAPENRRVEIDIVGYDLK